MTKILVSGIIVRKPFAVGSKSEHEAIVLETTSGDYKLRLAGENPFEDYGLGKFIGTEKLVTGELTGYTILVEGISELLP